MVQISGKVPLKAKALILESNEPAWKRGDLEGVIYELQGSGCSMLGGTIWCAYEETGGNVPFNPVLGKLKNRFFQVFSQIPLISGGTEFFSWETGRKRDDEPWNDYVSRTAWETLQQINRLEAEDQVLPRYRESLFYSLSFSCSPSVA